MAQLVSTRRTPWVRGPTAVVDAMVLGGVSTAHAIYFERVIPYTTFRAGGAKAIVDEIGAAIDTVLTDGSAIGASFVQEVDAAGLLGNYMEFTIRLASADPEADLTDTVLVPMQIVFTQGAAGIETALNDERSALVGRVQ